MRKVRKRQIQEEERKEVLQLSSLLLSGSIRRAASGRQWNP
jgi:hypothetical protein